ncbi:hypothetical protein SNOG_07945 [Parastagonospora nodorum SN15]|uniref:Uncharacterized protein n=1 Tax=Phaeosphaeria nodorum (strain SN15 / ATCC MYA-4574 / FGSC 10173) TaxID=321614 RepID=Q0UJW9_PHANO|nr:hypothetical protein SNOG_07945 [Parastagonospora nodorum SN15]EAT84221.1 hypothetical protein SNOG_07945 [Parastagonospora nodorum SN15]
MANSLPMSTSQLVDRESDCIYIGLEWRIGDVNRSPNRTFQASEDRLSEVIWLPPMEIVLSYGGNVQFDGKQWR